MKRRVLWLAGTLLFLALAAGLWFDVHERRRLGAERSRIAALEGERDRLRQEIDRRMVEDPRLHGMPDAPLRVNVPSALIRALVESLVAGFIDQVQLELGGIDARHRGEIKKLVTLGRYDLRMRIDRVTGRLETKPPTIRFGGNQIAVELPVSVAQGSGQATLDFRWDGRSVGDAVCGDQRVRRTVSGRVLPDRYMVRGSLQVRATAQQLVAEPRFAPTRLNLRIEPSRESWQAVQAIVDDKTGLCGFVLDRIDVPGKLRALLDRGIPVRLPTERIPSLVVPIGVESTVEVQGKPVALAVRLGALTIGEQSTWLGVFVGMRPHDEQASVRRPERAP